MYWAKFSQYIEEHCSAELVIASYFQSMGLWLVWDFGVRLTGSRTCALTFILHHVTVMLVRCLPIDFYRASAY